MNWEELQRGYEVGVVSAASRGSAGWNPPLLVLPGDGLSLLGSVLQTLLTLGAHAQRGLQ